MDAELKAGSNGIFTVDVDGKVVSKRSGFGFPSEEDIVGAVKQALAQPTP